MYFHLINFCTESRFVHFPFIPKRYQDKAMCVQNYHSHPNLLKMTAIVGSWPHSDSKVHYNNVLVLIASGILKRTKPRPSTGQRSNLHNLNIDFLP